MEMCPLDVRDSTSLAPHSFKLKRPTKLAIPAASFTISDKGVQTRWNNEVVVVEGDGYAVYCKKGKRHLVMEDRFKAHVVDDQFNGQPKQQAFFGVFDGHGGSKAAEFAAENLNKNILTAIEKMGENEITEAIKQGYLNTDSQRLPGVVSIGGTAIPLTSDHRPSRQDEKLRIESLGGYIDYNHGVPRVLGSLAVSRGIGDRSLKKWITAEPESKIIKITPEYEFLIMASDGLWDKVSNQEAIDLARPFCVGSDKFEPVLACKKLVELSGSRGSVDDACVMIVQLGRFCL
ncbi:hypothetical protein SSX86_015346 [Deinandra increscens subsp. villosa]|uniref:protein-serine/threonine phosphatase n=1 Tax=Deinandra increscens subsp. villosa TaxID=3103831 RepID=A0AAP0CZW8_9ASTR